MISLREITEENFNDCVNLKVSEDQKYFVATNVMSIAQSKVEPHWIPLAIYNDENLVGFTLYGQEPESKKYYIFRLMVDEKFQGRGYGKQATLKLIELMSKNEDCDTVYLYYNLGNIRAEKLYSNLGFEKTGLIDEDDGEIQMRFDLKRQFAENQK